METLSLISVKPILTLTSSPNPRIIPTKQCFGLPLLPKKPFGSLFISKPKSKTVLSAFFSRNNSKNVTTSTPQETTSVGVNPQLYVPPQSSQFGSPLFWIGVGVGFSALFSFVASWLKKYAMQQAFKTMMGQMGSQNNQFSNTAFPSGSPFGFPPPSTSGPSTVTGFPYQQPSTPGPSTSNATTTSSYRVTPSSPATPVTKDVSAKKPEVTEPAANDAAETEIKAKQSAFVDISPEETLLATPFENYDDTSSWSSSEAAKFTEVVQNGAVPNEGTSSEWSKETRKKGSLLSVEALEKMMEDPNIQKMIAPHLPEELRDPATFKWMLQNPVYRQQLQDLIDNMGDGALDPRMMDNLKSVDLNSPEVKQQFEQIGLTPEEAMSRIMSDPEIVMAFQNPRIQQAIMDCSQNPMNMMKYQNDKEVMDVFNKMQELFPGASGI